MKKLMLILFALGSFIGTAVYAQPTEIEKWTIRGDEYYNSGDYTNAINAYTQVIEIRQKEEDVAFERAKRNSYNKDIISFSRTWTGHEINAYLYRGRSYYKQKKYDEALADYEVVRQNYDPNFAYIYVCLGDTYGAKKDYENCSISYKKYIEKKSADESIGFSVDKSNKADMLFCAALWEKKLLSDDQKYEKWLTEICDKNKISRVEIESFYKQNRGW